MKHILLFFVISFCILKVNSQNSLILKSGEKMNGVVEQINDGILIFNFKGNKLSINVSDISIINFDEIQSQSLTHLDSNSKINGVVTYYFNKNYGDKPDIGSDVYIIDSLNCSAFSMPTIDSFYYASIYRSYFNSYKSMRKDPPLEIIQQLKNWGADSDAAFRALDMRASTYIFDIAHSENTHKLVVDGNGSYSKNVKSGTYYIIFKSNNRKSKIFFKKIILNSNDEKNVSYNFDKY